MAEANRGTYAHAVDINTGNETKPDPDDPLKAKQKLAEIAEYLAAARWKNVSFRAQSGIETIWVEDQDHYEGVDDANRHEHHVHTSKPPHAQEMLGDENDQSKRNSGSIVFPNITAPYVEAMAARVADVLLPVDGAAFKIAPTPIAELIEIEESLPTPEDMADIDASLENMPEGPERDAARRSAEADLVRQRLPKAVTDGVEAEAEEAYAGAPQAEIEAAKENVYLDLAKQIKEDMEKARKAAANAEKQIADWHVECQYTSEVRKVLENASRLGTGVLKGPVSYYCKKVAYKGGKLVQDEELKPMSASVDPWDCFPDAGCGENIHNGNTFFERDRMSKRDLAKLAGEPDYDPEAVGAVLEEGPMWVNTQAGKDDIDLHYGMTRQNIDELFEVWYCYAFLDRDDALQCGLDCEDMENFELIPIEATMVNNTIIRLILNPLETGEFPYDFMVLKKRVKSPWGAGVARWLREAQRIYKAACRNLMDNAGLAGGAMWMFLDGVVSPMDGNLEIRPRKGWRVNVEMLKDPRMIEWAFRFIEMPMKTDELLAIMQMALQMAEDTTGMPALMQGQQGKAPDTVGGMQILNQNSSTVLRRIAKLYDDQVNEPHIKRYYQYLLQYEDLDDGMKGDFAVDAKGSSALVEQAINDETIAQMGPLVENPVYGADPKKWFDLFLKSKRLDSADLKFDDPNWQKIVEGLAQQAQAGDPRVEIAQMNNQAKLQLGQLQAQLKQAELQQKGEQFETTAAIQMQRDERAENAQALRDEAMREFNAMVKDLDAQIEAARIDSNERMKLEELKKGLSETVMKLQAQFDMQATGGGEVTTPPVEPAGRAPEGQAFQR